MENKSRRTTIYFDPGVHQQLRMRAAETGRSVSDLVNEIIESVLEVESADGRYSIPAIPDGTVHESGVEYAGLTDRIERVERRIGILDDDPEAECEPSTLLTLADVKEKLGSNSRRLKELGVRSLSVFGSLAKQRFRSDSDIDFLVEYEQPAGLFRHIELEQYLANLSECEIDLVTARSLRPEMRNEILKEAVRVYPT